MLQLLWMSFSYCWRGVGHKTGEMPWLMPSCTQAGMFQCCWDTVALCRVFFRHEQASPKGARL